MREPGCRRLIQRGCFGDNRRDKQKPAARERRLGKHLRLFCDSSADSRAFRAAQKIAKGI